MALEDPSRDVRVSAIRIAERWLCDPHLIKAAVLARLDDPRLGGASQLAASLWSLPLRRGNARGLGPVALREDPSPSTLRSRLLGSEAVSSTTHAGTRPDPPAPDGDHDAQCVVVRATGNLASRGFRRASTMAPRVAAGASWRPGRAAAPPCPARRRAATSHRAGAAVSDCPGARAARCAYPYGDARTRRVRGTAAAGRGWRGGGPGCGHARAGGATDWLRGEENLGVQRAGIARGNGGQPGGSAPSRRSHRANSSASTAAAKSIGSSCRRSTTGLPGQEKLAATLTLGAGTGAPGIRCDSADGKEGRRLMPPSARAHRDQSAAVADLIRREWDSWRGRSSGAVQTVRAQTAARAAVDQ